MRRGFGKVVCLLAVVTAISVEPIWPESTAGEGAGAGELQEVEPAPPEPPETATSPGATPSWGRTGSSPGAAAKHAHHLRIALELEQLGQLDEAISWYSKALDSDVESTRLRAEAAVKRLVAKKSSARYKYVEGPLKNALSFMELVLPRALIVALVLAIPILIGRRWAVGKYIIDDLVGADVAGVSAHFSAELHEFIGYARTYYARRELWLPGETDSHVLVRWSGGLFDPKLLQELGNFVAPGLGSPIAEIMSRLLAPEYKVSGSVIESWGQYHVRATLTRKSVVIHRWNETLPTARTRQAFAQLAYEIAVLLVRESGGKRP